jgi:MSHA pilin protein MshC
MSTPGREPTAPFSFRPTGFTVVELVLVIVIVSILSAFVMTRFAGGVASTRGFYDELLAQVSYARKAAVAQRRAVFVRIDGAQSQLCYNSAGGCVGVSSPTGQTPFTIAPRTGVTVTAVTFQFDGLGRYRDSAGALASTPLTITVAGDGALSFTVWHDTGYVARP